MSEIHAKPSLKELITGNPSTARTGGEMTGELNDSVDDNIPVSLYESRFNRPYASEFFDVKNNFLMKLDDETTGKLESIDDFVINYMNNKELEDTKDNYNKVMNDVMKMFGIKEGTKANVKVDAMANAILLNKFFNK